MPTWNKIAEIMRITMLYVVLYHKKEIPVYEIARYLGCRVGLVEAYTQDNVFKVERKSSKHRSKGRCVSLRNPNKKLYDMCLILIDQWIDTGHALGLPVSESLGKKFYNFYMTEIE